MPDPGLYTERELLTLLAEGSHYAFTRIFEAHKDKVYRLGKRFLKSEAAAEELVQHVFMNLWRKRDERIETENLGAYIHMMARNRAYRMLENLASDRKKLEGYGHRKPGYSTATEDSLQEIEYRELVDKLLETLSPQQQRVFRLSKIEHKSNEDIAAELKINLKTVKRHLAYALARLREGMKDHLSPVIGLLAGIWHFFSG